MRWFFDDLLLQGIEVLELELLRFDGRLGVGVDSPSFEGKLKIFAIKGEGCKLIGIELAEEDLGFVFLVIFREMWLL